MSRQSAPVSPDPRSLGERFRDARVRKGLKVADVARLLDTKWQAVQEWELGKRMPRFEQGVRLARVLGMSIDEILQDGYEPPHEAWQTFLRAHPDITAGERRKLVAILWDDASEEPTVEAYATILTGLRLVQRRPS